MAILAGVLAVLAGVAVVIGIRQAEVEREQAARQYAAWLAERTRVAEEVGKAREWNTLLLVSPAVTASFRTTCRMEPPGGNGTFLYRLELTPASAVLERLAPVRTESARGIPEPGRPERRPRETLFESLTQHYGQREWQEFVQRRDRLADDLLLRMGATPAFVIEIMDLDGFMARRIDVPLGDLTLIGGADGTAVFMINTSDRAMCSDDVMEYDSWNLHSNLP